MTRAAFHPDFRWFLAGRFSSLLGSAMAPVALAFAVLEAAGGADLLEGTGDLGIVLAAHVVPLLAFLLIGGAVADRFPRRRLLLIANLGSGLTQGVVAVVLLTGNYHLFLIAGLEFANGALNAFTTPALRGIVPELVPKALLQQANSILGSTRNATRIVGPGLTGVLVVGLGGGIAIALDALSFVIAAGCLHRMTPGESARPTGEPTSEDPSSRGAVATAPTLLADIGNGWRAFARLRWVWTVSLTFCLINLVQTGTWQILGPALSADLGGTGLPGSTLWGLALSARGLGLLVSSLAMYRLRFRRLLAVGQLAGLFGAAPLIVLGLGSAPVWLILAAFTAGLGTSVSAISWDTSLQKHVRPEELSRVSSYDDLLSYITIPVGQLAVGPLAAAFGPGPVCLVAGLSFAVIAVLPLLSRSVRLLE
ncbi:MFS transporter [Nakamurella silvestris]|nr:MFS transporter [Nakamurella silvestris]